ncbi:putative carboxylesterase 17 [Canna indica]|uniref:Carboxylesterase 17 n=1 Tax=Canna indica TaxID=4628 RepID=A0AAQ3JN03_9LILI|nr:putative carboxylesterase 17 [Canna indica]
MWKRIGACDHMDHLHPDNVVEEIPGLLKVYKDGHIERIPTMPEVPCTWTTGVGDVTSFDVPLNNRIGLWVRFYVPNREAKLPLLVYFHGGGFCVGSATWRCYHEFLARLASAAGCLIMSVNYRLAPENRLPAAYDDGLEATKWLRHQANCDTELGFSSWQRSCDFSQVLLGGDSAGGSIAFHVAAELGLPDWLRGLVLIQPFFGGEKRTSSEKKNEHNAKCVLSLAASDCYWRLALPSGADRDHPWCNPLSKSSSPWLESLKLPPMFVCISEMDVLKDREVEFCEATRRAGKRVEYAIHDGVGHAFQVLGKSHASKIRTEEMIAGVTAFVNKTTESHI